MDDWLVVGLWLACDRSGSDSKIQPKSIVTDRSSDWAAPGWVPWTELSHLIGTYLRDELIA
jgi:hypothetical protein